MDWYVISLFQTDFTGQLTFVKRMEHQDTELRFTDEREWAHLFDEERAKALMNASHGAYAAVPVALVDRLIACSVVAVDASGHCEYRESIHVA